MIESQFQTKFMHWFLYTDDDGYQPNRMADQAVWEPKVTKGGTFNIKQWRLKQPHQYLRLRDAAGEKGVFWKISDADPRQKPWDCFFVANVPAYLVIWFDKYKRFFLIPHHQIPKQLSVSYDYCCEHFEAHELLKPMRKRYELE